MQAYTNRHLRKLYSELSASAVLWSEMEKAADLLANADSCVQRFGDEGPLVVQLGGAEPTLLARATRAVTAAHGTVPREFNLNCGCPSIESGGAGDFGASLMLKPALVADCCAAIADAAGARVSVKCRVGAVERLDGSACPALPYEPLHAFVAEISARGDVDHVVLHTRAAVLSGLSPSRNRQVPPLQPDLASRLAVDFPDLRITLNGGLDSLGAARRAAERPLSGVMAGRWLLRRPLDLWLIDEDKAFCTPAHLHSLARRQRRASSRADAVWRYGRYALEAADRGHAAPSELAAPLMLIASQLEEEVELRAVSGGACGSDGRLPEGVMGSDEADEVWGAVWEATASLSGSPDAFGDPGSSRRLAKLFKRLLGKKVAGKLARNRLEAVGQMNSG